LTGHPLGATLGGVPQWKSISIRFPPELIAAIEAVRKRTTGPLGPPEVAEVVRRLLWLGLRWLAEHPEDVEGPEKEGKKTR
jgi:hypothetical protein